MGYSYKLKKNSKNQLSINEEPKVDNNSIVPYRNLVDKYVILYVRSWKLKQGHCRSCSQLFDQKMTSNIVTGIKGTEQKFSSFGPSFLFDQSDKVEAFR